MEASQKVHRSTFLDLVHFNMFSQMLFDVMHIYLEGVMPLCLKMISLRVTMFPQTFFISFNLLPFQFHLIRKLRSSLSSVSDFHQTALQNYVLFFIVHFVTGSYTLPSECSLSLLIKSFESARDDLQKTGSCIQTLIERLTSGTPNVDNVVKFKKDSKKILNKTHYAAEFLNNATATMQNANRLLQQTRLDLSKTKEQTTTSSIQAMASSGLSKERNYELENDQLTTVEDDIIHEVENELEPQALDPLAQVSKMSRASYSLAAPFSPQPSSTLHPNRRFTELPGKTVSYGFVQQPFL